MAADPGALTDVIHNNAAYVREPRAHLTKTCVLKAAVRFGAMHCNLPDLEYSLGSSGIDASPPPNCKIRCPNLDNNCHNWCTGDLGWAILQNRRTSGAGRSCFLTMLYWPPAASNSFRIATELAWKAMSNGVLPAPFWRFTSAFLFSMV